MSRYPAGYEFESLMVDIHQKLYAHNSLTVNERILGKSGLRRQIDLSVRSSLNGQQNLKIVDAKDWTSPISVAEVDKLFGMALDVGAQRSALVSADGYTSGAIKRAACSNIELFTIVDPSGDHRWRREFNASTYFMITLIEDARLHFCDDMSYFAKHAHHHPLCLKIYDEQYRDLGRVHDLLFDLDLPIDDCTIMNQRIFDSPVLIQDSDETSGYRQISLAATLKLRTEAWEGFSAMLSGTGLYDATIGHAIISLDAVFDLVDVSRLRTEWHRRKSFDFLSDDSAFIFREYGLNQALCSMSHQCQ